jgi:adenosine deaminase
MRTELDFKEALMAYLKRAQSEGVLYVEVALDVQKHLENGVELEILFSGLRQGLNDTKLEGHSIEAKFVATIVGEKSEKEAIHLIDSLVPYKDLVVAIGLATSETDLPVGKFHKAFIRAAALGFNTTCHFWDHTSTEELRIGIYDCLLSRIDHGMCIVSDDELMSECV